MSVKRLIKNESGQFDRHFGVYILVDVIGIIAAIAIVLFGL